ncbi:hypothetical protein Bca52824_091723 [Brassica carinata]|uniref:HECT-type E3 ubiquitin transferase n=1 Tax=Brassica carinata TaxID=52824 RepID=A0A8X7TF75_BRACI|nr:hypothetical protein Bca52824_091723 [Brassica carinata]
MDASSRSEGKIHSFGSETRRFFYLHSNAFPLSLAIPPSRSLSGSPRLSSGLSALKLRLCPVHLETRHYVIYSSNIVLIDPLASLAAVEEKVHFQVLDDSLPMCTPDKVHDVKLGDAVNDEGADLAASGRQMNPARGGTSGAAATRGSDSADAGIGNSYGSKGALSFAAASMAGLGAASGRGIRGSRDLHGPTLYRSSELARQIQDALALCSGSLPSWCYQLTRACPFLFPFQTRRQYFYSTAFGLSRALNRLQQQQGADGSGLTNVREMRIGRLQRQKVRVSRNRILDSAAKVMEMYSSQKAVLEVEYFGEVGTGLGPTLEFYTLLSHDLQKVALGMWRSNSGDKVCMQRDEIEDGISSVARDKDIVQAPLGLFPRPWPSTADVSEGSRFHKVIEYFRLLGRVMAKALQDGRLLDVPLSTAFYKLILGQELDLFDITLFDAELGKTLQEFRVLVGRKQYLEAVGDICLDFTLPGFPEYILRPGDEIVDINSLEEYISLVVDATVKKGIARQLEAFRSEFNQAETLAEHIKFDHGYTAKSPAINLLEIMGELTADQQRAFCQFVTGAPRLPPGGLAVLNPKLTIVRKHSSTSSAAANGTGASETADDDLPSVMTCANYLKLPPYSTKEIMYKKLLYAINEGQGSFDLS